MHKILMACAIAILAATGYASAQSAQATGGDMRSQMMQMRADAKTASMNALSADHRTKVQAITDSFNAGKIDAQTATQQIDALLTPDESKAVLGQEQKMHDAMRAAMAADGGGQYGGPQGGPGGPGGGAGAHHHTPDAGRFLLMLNASPDKMHDMMHPGGGQQGPP